MIIKSLEIENFRSHKSTLIEFCRGINLIIGRNGAGKTSILDAIAVALYGNPYQTIGVRKENLVRDNSGKYEIRLKFELKGNEVLIVRSSDGKSYIKFDRVLEGDERIREWVERNVIPSSVWMNAVYVRQGEIEGILDDERREKIIKRITQIEDYERAWENLGKVIREFRERKRRLEVEVEEEKDVEGRLKDLKDERERKFEDLKRKERELEAVKEKLAILEEEKRRVERLKEEFEGLKKKEEELERLKGVIEERIGNLERRRREVEEEIEGLRDKLNRFKDLEVFAERYEALREEYERTLNEEKKIRERLSGLEERRRSILKALDDLKVKRDKLERLKSRLDSVRDEIAEVEGKAKEYERLKPKYERFRAIRCRDLDSVRSDLERIEKAKEKKRVIEEKYRELLSAISRLENEKERIERSLRELRSVKGLCPTCNRPLSDEQRMRLIEKFSEDLRNVKGKIEDLRSKLERLDDLKSKIEDVLSREGEVLREYEVAKEFEDLREELKDFERLEEAWKLWKERKEEMISLSTEISTLESDLKKENDLLSELKVVEGEIEELKRKMEGLKRFDENELKVLEESYKEYQRLLSAKESYEKALNNLKLIEEEIERERGKLSEVVEELEEVRKRLNDLDYDEGKYRSVIEEHAKLKVDCERLRESTDMLKDHLKTIDESIKDLEIRLKKVREKMFKLEKISKEIIPKLEEIREKFRKYRVMLEEYAFKEVERIASEIFEEMTDGKYSGIVLKREEERREKVKMKVVYQGVERDLSFLSGGEKIALGLAFRLALSSFLIQGNVPILILDEPTPFLDEERRRRLIDIMNRYLKRIPQVIVVTHDEELRDVADRLIRVELQGGVSRVVQ